MKYVPQIKKKFEIVAYKIATKLLESPPGSSGKGAHSPADCGSAPTEVERRRLGGRNGTIKNRIKVVAAIIGAKCRLMAKREGSDQLIVMFIIIAVAAGIAGLLTS